MDVIGRCSNLRMATGVGTVEEDAEGSPKMEEEGQPWRANEPGGWWQIAGRQGWAAGDKNDNGKDFKTNQNKRYGGRWGKQNLRV